jgi:tetratricopeptide (TPR) repeat protein
LGIYKHMNQSVRTFKIDRGIGQYNSSDYFAILGLPVTADALQIRKRYLNIARNLHPDVYGRAPEEKHKACEYLAKLVSPAYNMLMQDRERVEYSALLKLIAKRLMKRELKMTPKSDIAKNLLSSPSEPHYIRSVEAIARLQYQSLDKILEYTAQLSELNLIYIMYQEGYHPSLIEPPQAISTPSSNRAQNYLNLAEEYIGKKQWTMALGELRAALPLEQTNSKCHALLGLVYLNQNLGGMAKVSFQQALKLNPKDPLALAHITKCVSATNKAEDKKKKGSGFFGWLGGS